MNVTEQQLQLKCDLLNELLELPIETYADEQFQIGNIHVENHGDGWQVRQIVTEMGDARHPKGAVGLTAGECLMWLEGAIAGAAMELGGLRDLDATSLLGR